MDFELADPPMWAVPHLSLGKMPKCLPLGRGVRLEHLYNCVKTYSQSGPLEMQADKVPNASPIVDTQA